MSSNIYMAILILTIFQLLLLREYGCIDNVALNKPAQQKSTWYHADRQYDSSAWRAVDGRGRVPGEPEEGCASTSNPKDKDAWWMVNLQRLYVIVNITVTGKADSFERLRDFYIRVGNSSDITEHAYCAYKSGWVKLRVTETFRCNSILVGSWISIQRTNNKGYNNRGGHGWLQLCEVQVYGYEKTCGHRKFGPTCQNICHCANNWDCKKETGVCPEGACEEGYGDSTCSIKLPTLYWRNENTARPVDNTNHVRIIFYQFKRGNNADLDSGEGPVTEYSVDVKEEGSIDWVPIESFKHDDTKDRLNVTVTSLKYYRNYTMRVVPWYQRDNVKLNGRAEGTFTVKTDCGKPDKPKITDITAKRVTGGANMAVSFTLSKGGHNCASYKLVDLRRRVLPITSTEWTDSDWFGPMDERVEVFIAEIDMTKMHQVQLTVYNNANKGTDSEIWIFMPITVAIPWRPTATVRITTRRMSDVTDVYPEIKTPDKVSTEPSVNDKSEVNAGTITGGVISAIFLIIIIALLIYIWRLKRGCRTNQTKAKGTHQVKNKQVSRNQDDNIRAEVPGMDGEYESKGLSTIGRHSYVNVEGNKYETLDKQQITTPEQKTYAKLGPE